MKRRSFLALCGAVPAAVAACVLPSPVQAERPRRADVVAFKARFGDRYTYEHASDCHHCRILGYDTIADMGYSYKDIPKGWKSLPSRAGYAIPCPAHDVERQHRLWIHDVPDEVVARQLDREQAFCLDDLAEYLPGEHPAYRRPRGRG
jgi:hypothetical protein